MIGHALLRGVVLHTVVESKVTNTSFIIRKRSLRSLSMRRGLSCVRRMFVHRMVILLDETLRHWSYKSKSSMVTTTLGLVSATKLLTESIR